MAPGSAGTLQLGWPAGSPETNKFVGTCQLSGTIPSGWTVDEAPFSTLSAEPGSGNAGSFVWDTDDSTFADPGTFLNSGRFVDESNGFTQQIEVARFVNSGTILSTSTGLGTVAPAEGSSVLEDLGTVQVSAKDSFSSGTTFELEPSGTIGGPGSFSIANLSVFDVLGGSVSGTLTTSQFLGRGPATIEFAPRLAGSHGAISVSTTVNLQGVIGKHWTLTVDSGSVAASDAGNAGHFIFGPGEDDAALSDSTPFVNTGTLADDAKGFTQDLQTSSFVNDGRVISRAPGFGIAGPTAGHAATFVDRGVLAIAAGAVFAASGTFDLEPSGSVINLGAFDIAGTTLDVLGGSLHGNPGSNPYHLGALPTTVEFAPTLTTGSSGGIDAEITTRIVGVIPRRWVLRVTSQTVTATSSGNDGTLIWAGSGELQATGNFVNAGRTELSGDVQVSAAKLVNAPGASIIVSGLNSRLTVTGPMSNNGTLSVGPGSKVSVNGTYSQSAGGSLGMDVLALVAGPYLQASGTAALAGTLLLGDGGGYTPQAGLVLPIVTAAAIAGKFAHVADAVRGPGIVSHVTYSHTAVSVDTGK